VGRVAGFHAAVDERFCFLIAVQLRCAHRTSADDRFGQVWFEANGLHIYLSWDSYSGELEAEVEGKSLWPAVVAAGLWDAGRYQAVYMGASVAAMEHGLDRVVTLLKAHPELLDSSFRRAALAALIDVAERMIAGEIGPIEGSQTIVRLIHRTGDAENDVFLPFRGIASESDDMIVGDRTMWATEFLERIDREYEDYDRRLRPTIADDCKALLAVFVPRQSFWIAMDAVNESSPQ
jgi:hypothetical protein